MPDSLAPVDSVLGARYRYYTVNIVTNTVIGEIPFEDVSYERSVKAPGAFDGKITISDQTSNLDLYNATLPGKTALYVVRNDEAVWGGIIWGRTYDLKGRSLAVSASEFTSYLSHRIIWKTYSHDCSAKLTKATSSSYVLVTIQDKVLKAAPAITDNAGNPNYVTITFSDNAYRKYSGSYKIVGKSSSPAAPANPGRAAFYVDIPALPKKSVGVYDGVGVTLKADTYEFLRDIITSTFSDFTDIEFPNAIIEPGIKIPYELDTKQLTITDDSNGVATITTKSEHDLTAGQRIEIVNVDPMLDGFHTISATPTKYSFQYVLTNPISRHDNVSRVYLDSSLSTPVSLSASVDMVKVRQVVEYLPQYVNYVQRVSGVITATFNSVHTFKKGDKVIVNFEKNGVTEKLEEVKTKNTDGTTTTKKEKVNTFDFKKYNDTVTVTSATANAITFLDPDPDHVSPGYDTKGNVSPSKNSIKNAAPLPLLLLYPQNSSGYNMGDDIRVDGVDDAGWQYPVYDGYHKVYEVSPGKTYSITKYKAESDWLTEDTDDVDDKRVIAYVYCTTDPGIEAGDEFVVSGITGTTALNGTYTALLDSFLDPTYSLYAVPYIKQISAVSITTQASGASLVKNGETWIAYQPGTSELRYSLKNEPDADSGISKFEYTAAKGDKKNVVQITTKSRHGLKIGDTVKIVYGQSDKNVDQETYGGTVKVTAVQDYDTFSYTLIKGKHKKDAPKKDVELTDKSGTVTRLRHGILNPEIVQEEIDSVRTEITAAGATQVTVYAPGHNFKKGDYISVSVNDSNYKGINTEATPKKITSAAGNYFRYISGSPVVEGQTSSLSQIIYSKDGSTVKYKASKFAAAYTAATRTATLLEPNKTTGFVTFTTSVSHGFVVGQKVTVAGFVAPTASSSTTTTRNHTISSVTYDANTKTAIVRFTSAHSLRPLVDVGASFTVAGANKTAVWPSGTTTFPFVDISWLNATHTIVDIPDTTSIAIKYLGLTGNWVVFSGASGVGSPTTVQTVTVTQNVYDPQDLTAFNMTAEVASVPSVTKIALKYPDSSDSALGSSISLTGLGITIQGFASNATTAEQLEAGDFIYISGLTDSGENYYSKLNGDGFKVKSIAAISGDTTNVYVTIANPVRADGKYIKYADKTSGVPSTAKMYRGYDVDGTAYLSPAALESGDTKNNYILTNVARSSGSNTATITIGTHDLTVGDYINVEVFASNQAAFSQNSRDCKITSITDTTISYTMKANNDIEYVSWRAGRATLYFKNSTAGAHNYVVGDVITVSSLPAPFTGYNGTGKTIVATGPFSITYTYSGPTKKVAKTAVTAGSITRTTSQSVNKAVYGIVTRVPAIYKKPIAYARTYGEFPTNANIGGLTFSTNNYSTKNQGTSPIYGSELKTVSEILDQYSNSLTGFDYRIDVSLSTDQNGNKSFSRQFVLIPTYPESLTNYLASLPGGKLAKGQVARPSAFGADKLVFEYPGNISNVSMAEKAENSATRVFVTGSSSKAGDGTETPYAAAADNSLLADNWPLLDKKETVTWPAQGNNSASSTSKTSNTYTDEWGNHDDETDYYASAKRFLAETKPPAGDFVITVNGSLTPVVGSYNPGEWCSIIINDNFVKTRLNSVLEPRKDVIVRKIDAIKVDVPNNPAFPENINLTLVADWQVDSVGK